MVYRPINSYKYFHALKIMKTCVCVCERGRVCVCVTHKGLILPLRTVVTYTARRTLKKNLLQGPGALCPSPSPPSDTLHSRPPTPDPLTSSTSPPFLRVLSVPANTRLPFLARSALRHLWQSAGHGGDGIPPAFCPTFPEQRGTGAGSSPPGEGANNGA